MTNREDKDMRMWVIFTDKGTPWFGAPACCGSGSAKRNFAHRMGTPSHREMYGGTTWQHFYKAGYRCKLIRVKPTRDQEDGWSRNTELDK